MSNGGTFKKSSHSFYEKQSFRSWLLYAILIIVEIFFIALTIEKILANRPWGLESTSTWFLIIFTLLFPTGALIGFYITYFETIMSEEGVFYRWGPFKRNYRMLEWQYVKEISIIDLRSAGFAWRFSSKYGEVHYLGGGYGVQIKMRSGRRKLLGTQKPEELNRILIRIAGNKYQLDSKVKRSLEF